VSTAQLHYALSHSRRWRKCAHGLGSSHARHERGSAVLHLEGEDIREALRYAADAVRERKLPLTVP
jgi:hypothetical protein